MSIFCVISRGAPGMTDNIPSPLTFDRPPLTLYTSDSDILVRLVIFARQWVIGMPETSEASRSFSLFRALRKLWRRTIIGIEVRDSNGAPTLLLSISMSSDVGSWRRIRRRAAPKSGSFDCLICSVSKTTALIDLHSWWPYSHSDSVSMYTSRRDIVGSWRMSPINMILTPPK